MQLLPRTDHRRPLWHQERKRRERIPAPEQYEHDGKVGANTWNALYAKYTAKHGLAVPYPGIVMRTGMSGGTIRLIQQKLNTLGEKIGTDGKFGSRTAAAVQRFQRRNGLNADGAVGKATWEKLFPAS